MLTEYTISCPYCGESFTTLIDYSDMLDNDTILDTHSSQDYNYIEDCQICCQPIIFTPVINSNGLLIDVLTKQENE